MNTEISICSTWLSDLEKLSRNDGYDDWRRNEHLELKKIIKERFEILQNPEDCGKAKIFKCYAYPEIGWGNNSESHFIAVETFVKKIFFRWDYS